MDSKINEDKITLKTIDNELLKIDSRKLMVIIEMLFDRLGQDDRPFMEKAIHTMREIKHNNNMYDSVFYALHLVVSQYIHKEISGKVNNRILDRANLTERVEDIISRIKELDKFITQSNIRDSL